MSPRRALVVEDDPDQLHMVSSILGRLGMVVVQAASGGQLLDKLAHAAPFDLIITDVSMPAMTGVAALQLARAVGVTAPVIVMTAMRDPGLADQIAALGPALLLHKPFSMAALRTAVQGILHDDEVPAAPELEAASG